jgi:hypothetical protein
VCVCYLNILGTTAAPSAAAQARGDRGHCGSGGRRDLLHTVGNSSRPTQVSVTPTSTPESRSETVRLCSGINLLPRTDLEEMPEQKDRGKELIVPEFPGTRPKPDEMKTWLDGFEDVAAVKGLAAAANGQLPDRVASKALKKRSAKELSIPALSMMLPVAHGARLPLWFPNGTRPHATLMHIDCDAVRCAWSAPAVVVP